MLEKGMAWRVGDGRSINIWKDRWLPNIHNPSIISPRKNMEESARVSDLMVSGEPYWDHLVIDEEFLPGEAALIKSIPISRCGLKDRHFWLHTKNGLNTVKLGYHLIKDKQQEMVASTSYGAAIVPDFKWKRLWSLPIPEHIKVFGWRAIKVVLPIAVNLVKKKVLVNSTCSLCKEATESMNHCFRECHIAS